VNHGASVRLRPSPQGNLSTISGEKSVSFDRT
jgi:hypothetical protein